MNNWITHVKQYATLHKISFTDALKSVACREAYKQHEKTDKSKPM